MKYSVIDMGSNSIRLMIATVESGQLIHAEKTLAMTRLGAGVDASKTLCEASMAATIEAVAAFKEQSEREGAEMLGAFATSAVRDAINGQAFAERVLAETGVEVSILPGHEEAELGYKGVLSGLGDTTAHETFVIIDIGGGSTELIVGTLEGIAYRHSFNVGTVRMTGKHIHTDPIADEEAAALQFDVAQILQSGVEAVRKLRPTTAIGIGGTATTFGAMDLKMKTYDRSVIHNTFVGADGLKNCVQLLKKLTVEEKKHLDGLMPKRADVIYAGGVILDHLLSALELEGFYVSDYDNLEGILVEKKLI